MAYSSGPQGGISFSTPRYRNFEAITNFNSSGGVNPLDDHLPHPFNRIIGQQTLQVRNLTTGFIWSFDLEGGSNALSNGYIGEFDSSANYIVTSVPINCQVTPINVPPPITVRVNRYSVRTTAADGNKNYILEFSPFPNVNPLITLLGGTLAGESLEVKTKYTRFLLG